MYFSFSEISLLTAGEKELNYEMLMKVIVFSGADSVYQNYFKRYL